MNRWFDGAFYRPIKEGGEDHTFCAAFFGAEMWFGRSGLYWPRRNLMIGISTSSATPDINHRCMKAASGLTCQSWCCHLAFTMRG